MPAVSKKEADAYDRMIDAAARLAELIESGGIDLPEEILEELCIRLARNCHQIRSLLKGVTPRR